MSVTAAPFGSGWWSFGRRAAAFVTTYRAVSRWRHVRAIILLPGTVTIVVPAILLATGDAIDVGWERRRHGRRGAARPAASLLVAGGRRALGVDRPPVCHRGRGHARPVGPDAAPGGRRPIPPRPQPDDQRRLRRAGRRGAGPGVREPRHLGGRDSSLSTISTSCCPKSPGSSAASARPTASTAGPSRVGSLAARRGRGTRSKRYFRSPVAVSASSRSEYMSMRICLPSRSVQTCAKDISTGIPAAFERPR